MFSETITLYNLHEDEWYPTVLHGCCLICDKAARQAQTGIENADKASLYIPKSSIDAANVVAIGPKEYEALRNPAGYITFNEGTDFFIKGEQQTVIIGDEDYPSGYYNYINQVKDDVYMITSAAEYDLIPHYEIAGR